MNYMNTCVNDRNGCMDADGERIELCLPAHPRYARCVRMLAANIAVVCNMSVDDVEDVRMAAEEAFVYSCSTSAEVCQISVQIEPARICMDATLGKGEFHNSFGEDVHLVEMMLDAVCDSHSISEGVLHLEKMIGTSHVS